MNASGSLESTHLAGKVKVGIAADTLRGSCVYANENVEGAVGRFPFNPRPANEKPGKARVYRLISAQFHQFVASLHEQNTSNMGISDFAKFPLTVPTELDAVLTVMTKNGKELESIERQR